MSTLDLDELETVAVVGGTSPVRTVDVTDLAELLRIARAVQAWGEARAEYIRGTARAQAAFIAAERGDLHDGEAMLRAADAERMVAKIADALARKEPKP